MSVDYKRCWYEFDRGDVHSGVSAEVTRIKRQMSEQRQDMIDCMEMYANGNVSGLGKAEHARSRLHEYAGDTMFNMMAAGVDTAVSMIAQTPAIPMYLTTGGDYGLMRKAKKRSQVLQGQMNELAGELVSRAFLDAAKVGTGFIHDYVDDLTGTVKLKRVHPLELLVEHADGLYGEPKSCHYIRILSKETLRQMYPKARYQIDQCASVSADALNDFFLDLMTDRSQVVEVWESWHVGVGKSKGRHTITMEGCDLLDEAWTDDTIPFTPIRYRERDFGYYGAGLIESGRSSQNRVNDLIARVARGQDLASQLVILNPNGVNSVKPAQITNELGLILNFDSDVGPPQLAKWDGTLTDLQQQITIEFERWLQVEGLTPEQVNGEGAGQGLDSGVAVRAADDVQTRRLVSPIKRFQASCIAIAKRIEARNNQLAKLDESYKVTARAQEGRQTFLTSSTWADLTIPEGQAQIAMLPMSALPTTPQGKWAAVMEWIDAGFVSQQYAMSLLQFPDLDSYADTQLAHMDMAQWQVEQILDGKSAQPYPRQNLEMAIDIVTRSELKAITMHADPPIIDAFESFLVRCEELMEAAAAAAAQKMASQQPAPQQAPMQHAGPPGAPQGPPQGGQPPGPPQGARPMQVAPQQRPAPLVQAMPA